MPRALTTISKHMDLGPEPGLLGFALDTAVGGATSFGLGELYARKGSESALARNAGKLTALVGKLGAVAIQVMTGGRSHIASTVLDSAGQAGLNAWMLDLGMRQGLKAKGLKAMLVPEAALPPGSSPLQIGAAHGMTREQLDELVRGIDQ